MSGNWNPNNGPPGYAPPQGVGYPPGQPGQTSGMAPYGNAPQGYPQPQQSYPPGFQPNQFGAPGYPPNPMMGAPVNIVVQNTQVATGAAGIVRVGNRSKGTAVILAFLLGGIGAHKFYLGQTLLGLIYFVFCWTFIPAMIALVETILLVMMSEHEFDLKYNSSLAR